jgi:hypothetical protein
LGDQVQVGPKLVRSNKEVNPIRGLEKVEEIIMEGEVKFCSIVHGCEFMEQWWLSSC